MQIVTQPCQINSTIKFRIIQCSLIFELERKRQIILYVWIGKIRKITTVYGMTQSIIKHDLCSRFTIDLCDQMTILRHSISVQVYQNLYRWILFQNRFQPLSCIVICFAPVKFPSSQIKCFRYMHNLVAIIFCQKLSQIITHPHNRIFCLSFS